MLVLEASEKFGVTAVFSQDLKDTFTSVNDLKRRLAHPEVFLGFGVDGTPKYHRLRLVDIASYENIRIDQVKTVDGRFLHEFHNSLFDSIYGSPRLIVDEADWITRNGRGDLRKLYERHMAQYLLNVVIEDIVSEADHKLFKVVVYPSFLNVFDLFGIPPLIVPYFSFTPNQTSRHSLSHAQSIIVSQKEISANTFDTHQFT